MNGVRRPLRVLALAPYPEAAPSTRVRVAQFLPDLEGMDIRVTLHPFFDDGAYARARSPGGGRIAVVARALLALTRRLRQVHTFDVVWVQRGVAPFVDMVVQQVLARAGVPVVFDFDDAIYLPQEGGRWWVEALRRPRAVTRGYCQIASVVLAGNPHLADFARIALGATEAHRVRVLPSAVDTTVLAPSGGTASPGPPTLGWIGSDTTIPYLERIAPALADLARRTPFRLLVVAGGRRPHLPGVAVDVVPWSVEDEAARIREMDVGLYPLEDTAWSRGKCGFKALQYLACGVPCVASPVGVLRDIVRPGETGLLASTPGAWGEVCGRLLEDPALRAEMGRAGRARVEAHYSVRAVLPVLRDALNAAAGTPRA